MPVAEAASVARLPLAPSRYRVTERRGETRDVVTLALEPVDEPLGAGAPGQFHMLWAFGVGEVPISIAGLPADDGSLLHTIRAVGPVTAAICATEPGGVLGIRGPFGSGWDLETAQGLDVAVVAGGIGLAPLRPAMVAMARHHDAFGKITLIVGARAPEELLYLPELEHWGAMPDTHVEVTVDHASTDWKGEVGIATRLITRHRFDPDATVALVCGPEIMMRFAARALVDQGIPAGRIRLSMERNMHCAIAQCGHCQLGPEFLCREGPVLPYPRLEPLMRVPEL